MLNDQLRTFIKYFCVAVIASMFYMLGTYLIFHAAFSGFADLSLFLSTALLPMVAVSFVSGVLVRVLRISGSGKATLLGIGFAFILKFLWLELIF